VDAVETSRLLLRPFEPSDRDALVALHAIEQFWWFPLRRAQTAAETDEFLARRLLLRDEGAVDLWAALDKATGALVGWAGLGTPDFLPEILPAIEVGWRLDPAVWGRGLATEAGAAGLDYGFGTLGLDEIVSVCEPANVASERVMEKLGMRLERVTVHPARGVPVHVRVITAGEWRARSRGGGTVRSQ
jgi:RimJ/RimL family protein N-acetyltransferase